MGKISPQNIRAKQALAKAKQVHGNKYDYSKVKFKTQHEKVTIICPVHGEWQQRFHSHLAGYGCPNCGREKMIETKSFSAEKLRETFVKNAISVHGNYFDYSKVCYVGKSAKSKVTIIDPYLGEFEQTYGNHVLLKHRHPKHYLTIGRTEHINSKFGSIKDRRKEFLKVSRKIHNNEYSYPFLLKEFKGFASSITVLCPNCGPIKQDAHNHMKGHGCKTCARSFLEKQIHHWLVKIANNANIIINDRKLLKGKELDLYVPKYKLAIEVCGTYWHAFPKVAKNYHIEKHQLCAEKGISLITLFDCDWHQKHKRLIIKSRIKAKLGQFKTKVGARQCEIREVTFKVASNFLQKNHLQGKALAKYNIGLYYGGKLVSLLTLGKPRFNSKYEWEIIRFCNKRNIAVMGSFSKLFKWAVEKYNMTSVITYSDLRWGSGNVYTTAAFKWLRNTQPAPWYTHVDGKREFLHRTHMQKHKLKALFKNFDNTKTAEWNISKNYYVAVYDCGNAVYEWRKS